MPFKDATSILRGILRLISSYLNAYVYCAIFICILLLFPIFGTRTPIDTYLIKQGQLAISNVATPQELPHSAWKHVQLPARATYIASNKIINEWFSVSLPFNEYESGNSAILIRDFPLGGTIFLGDKELYHFDIGEGDVVNRNDLPVYVSITASDLALSRTLYIKTRSFYSFSDLEPIYFGNEKSVYQLYKNYLNWNVEYQNTVAIVAFIFMCFFAIAFLKNRDIEFFKHMFFLSFFYFCWEEIVVTGSLSINHWLYWRINSLAWAALLFYFFIVAGLSVVKIKVPKFMKYFTGIYILLGSTIMWYDYDGLFFYTQVLLYLMYLAMNAGVSLIFYKAWKEKDFNAMGLGLIFIVASPGTIHDFMVWTGAISEYNAQLAQWGIPEFFLQSNNLSHLVAIPYLLVTGFTLLKIIEDKERYKTESAIAIREERARIVRDLHDGLGAVLTMGAIQAQNGTLTIDKAKVTIRESLNDLRLILNGFSTEVPNMAAIIETIGEQAKKMFVGNQKMDIYYQLPDVSIKEPKLSQLAAMNLAKITREALTNALKYSEGTELYIELKYSKSDVIVEVKDNGPTGFDFEYCISHPTGNGLQNMRSRANTSQGTFTYISEPGCTKMIATMPVRNFSD